VTHTTTPHVLYYSTYSSSSSPFSYPSFLPLALYLFNRGYLCQSLVTATKLKDKSSSLLETLTSSLTAAYSPYEVVTASARRSCARALLQVSTLARQGYLLGEFNVSQKVADCVSEFTVLNNNTVSNISAQAVYPINTAVSYTHTLRYALIHVPICMYTHMHTHPS
jgi:hypothetical protein